MSDQPMIGGRMPIQVDVTAGETYWWCVCGRSKTQPFCDGSHKDTGLSPLEYTAERTRRLMLCTCKRTAKPPICNNSHLKL